MKDKNENYGVDTRLLWKISGVIFLSLGLAYSIGYAAHLAYNLF